MPSIKDQTTVEAVARVFCSNGRNAELALKEVGYSDNYAEHRSNMVLSSVVVVAAIKALDDAAMADSELTIAEVLDDLAFGMRIARENSDIPGLARLSELRGKYLAMWSESGNNSKDGLQLNFTTTERKETGKTIKLHKETG